MEGLTICECCPLGSWFDLPWARRRQRLAGDLRLHVLVLLRQILYSLRRPPLLRTWMWTFLELRVSDSAAIGVGPVHAMAARLESRRRALPIEGMPPGGAARRLSQESTDGFSCRSGYLVLKPTYAPFVLKKKIILTGRAWCVQLIT